MSEQDSKRQTTALLSTNLEDLGTEAVTVSFGPQHPSTHGVFQAVLRLDGEQVVDADLGLGYLHRGTEKLMEIRAYNAAIPLVDRLDYLAAMNNNHAVCLAVERLAGLVVPERAEYIRVIAAELNRIASHLVAAGTFGLDVGVFATSAMYTFEAREAILDLFVELCGARMTFSYFRYGGVAADLTEGFEERCRKVLEKIPRAVEELHTLLTGNEIFRARSIGIGYISPEDALDYAMTGPNLRATGIPYDIRRARPYSIYDRLDFEVITEDGGDCFARYMVRMREVEQSIRCVGQCLEQMRPGDVQGRAPAKIKPPPGEAYAEVEAPKGALGIYVVSDGSANPYRMKIRAPSYINLGAFPAMARGWKVADMIAILGSLDFVMGEVDR
jgi:NADH-quinone oxidoreductase subunit D